MLINLNLREDLLKYFPNFEYFNCTEPERLDFSLGNNLVGQQQEAFIYYWLLKTMQENPDGYCAVDLGCGQNIHFSCLGINNYAGEDHPIYHGGPYKPQITSTVEDIYILNKGTFAAVVASHIIEHTKEPAITFRKWCKLLRHSGRIIVLFPDARYETELWDPTHVNFFSPNEFKRQIIKTNCDLLEVECFDDLHNKFSSCFV